MSIVSGFKQNFGNNCPGYFSDASSMDGLDQYDMIMNGGASVRDEIVYNIDMEDGQILGQAAIR